MQQENVVMLNCLFLPTGLVAGGWTPSICFLRSFQMFTTFHNLSTYVKMKIHHYFGIFYWITYLC